MKSKHSTHAAGHAAYTPGSSTQEGAGSASSSEETSEIDPSAEPQKTSESGLTAREQQMIEENFPEDPELSMRLYGRGRDAEMVRGSAVGENLDVLG